MNTNTKIVLGGIAGVACAVGLGAGLIAFSSTTQHAAPAREPAPIESPNLEPELANTHQPSVQTPRVVQTPVPEPSYEPVLAGGEVRLNRLIVASGIAQHEPTGASDTFELGAQPHIYAFVDAVNETDEPVTLRVTFVPEHGETAGHVRLEIPANVGRFRTWAYTRHVYTAGRWEAVVRDERGRVIARRPFEVVR